MAEIDRDEGFDDNGRARQGRRPLRSALLRAVHATRRGRQAAVAALGDLVHADATGAIDLEGDLGDDRVAFYRPPPLVAPGRPGFAVLVHPPIYYDAEVETSYGSVELLEVTVLDPELAALAESEGANAAFDRVYEDAE